MKTERAIVLGDIHFPFQDDKAIELLFTFLKWFKPNKVILNGDITDCWEVSKFSKPLNIQNRLKDELEASTGFLKRLRATAGSAEIIYIFGNHEFRFERYISENAKELNGLKGLSLEEQLELKELDIRVINHHHRDNYLQHGKYLLIGHFNKTNKHSGYTAKNLVEEKGISIIQNHTHRGGMSYKTDHSGTRVGFENYCLCSLEPPYMALPNWQQGFCTIHTYPSGRFNIFPVVIIDGSIRYGDKEFGHGKAQKTQKQKKE